MAGRRTQPAPSPRSTSRPSRSRQRLSFRRRAPGMHKQFRKLLTDLYRWHVLLAMHRYTHRPVLDVRA
jgi:hypothetical protein